MAVISFQRERRRITVQAIDPNTGGTLTQEVEATILAGTGLAHHKAIDREAYHLTSLASGGYAFRFDFRDEQEAEQFARILIRFFDFTGESPRIVATEQDIWALLACVSVGAMAHLRGVNFFAKRAEVALVHNLIGHEASLDESLAAEQDLQAVER